MLPCTRFAVALPDYLTRLREEEEKLVIWLGAFGIELSNEAVLKYLDPRAAMRFGANILSGLGGVLTNTFIILIAVIFMLLEASGFPAKLRAISRDPHASVMSLNNAVESFPGNMVAGVFGFRRASYFEVAEVETGPVVVDLR